MSNLLSYFRLLYCEKIMNNKKEIQFYAVLIKILDYSLLLSYHLI